MVVLQTCLHDDTGGTDMGPLDGDAQPVVAGAPTARSDEDVVFVLVEELAVDLLNLGGNGGVVDGREIVAGFHIDHIDHIL